MNAKLTISDYNKKCNVLRIITIKDKNIFFKNQKYEIIEPKPQFVQKFLYNINVIILIIYELDEKTKKFIKILIYDKLFIIFMNSFNKVTYSLLEYKFKNFPKIDFDLYTKKEIDLLLKYLKNSSFSEAIKERFKNDLIKDNDIASIKIKLELSKRFIRKEIKIYYN